MTDCLYYFLVFCSTWFIVCVCVPDDVMFVVVSGKSIKKS